MKASKKFVLFFALLLFAAACFSAAPARAEKLYYAIKVKGVLCGYTELETAPLVKDGRDLIHLKQRVFVMLSALGSEFNTEVKVTYHIDPKTDRFIYNDIHIQQGQVKFNTSVVVEGNTARHFSSTTNKEIAIDLPPDVILENSLAYPHLKKAFVEEKQEKKKFKTFDVREGKVHEVNYTKVKEEKLELAGTEYNAVVLESLNLGTGLKMKVWLDPESTHIIKTELPQDKIIYLADPSVIKKIEMANIDETIIAKTNVSIADMKGISYMKVKAIIEPSGKWFTVEGLNVPGQKFAGTVKENLIEGIFEIEHPRYYGADAPPFPPDFSKDETLRKYLEPQELIECDDPVLNEKARELTKGAANSWEAACRLSKWVAENITYAIPGGVTARKTYDMKAGECGAHSMLVAAFCRTVGIPARVIWGCMYAPNYGGAFGQHGWNEIYMGKAGWIPVDSTAFEHDFVDSGHIRLGIHQSYATALNARKFEVLDYRVGSEKDAAARSVDAAKYNPYLGEYTGTEGGTALKVLVQDGCLTVDIPGKIVLALHDPGKEEKWYSKITNRLYFTFSKNDTGKVNELILHEMISVPRRSDPETIDAAVPEEMKPYLGEYFLAPVQVNLTVLYKDGGLAVDDPSAKRVVKLQAPDENGWRMDEFNKNAISFELDEKGKAKSMIIDSRNRFRR